MTVHARLRNLDAAYRRAEDYVAALDREFVAFGRATSVTKRDLVRYGSKLNKIEGLITKLEEAIADLHADCEKGA